MPVQRRTRACRDLAWPLCGYPLVRLRVESAGSDVVRLLFLCKCSPFQQGGAETRTREVALRLARAGHDVTVVCGKTEPGETEVRQFEGVTILCKRILPDWLLRRYRSPHYFPLAAASLLLMIHVWFLLKRHRFDVIREDISPFPPSSLLALVRLPARERIAVVHNLSGTFRAWVSYYGPIYGLAGFFMDRLLRSGVLKYDRIVAVGKWFADELGRHRAISGRVHYVPNGIDLQRFRSCRPVAGRRGNRLLCVGRLAEMKGQRYAIEAVACLKSAYPATRLTLLGTGPLREPLAHLAEELAVAGLVEFRTSVDHGAMPAIYDEHDFLVLPSLSEGFPLVLLEAMAMGVPIVAADIPGVRTVLHPGAAIFFPAGDAAAMAAKLHWAFDHPALVRQMAERAHRVVERYSWDCVAYQEIQATWSNGSNADMDKGHGERAR